MISEATGAARNGANRTAAVFTEFFRALPNAAGSWQALCRGGEQQMLAIGRGLMAEPKLLIMDEPSLGLSPLLVEELFSLIRSINADGYRSYWSNRTSSSHWKSHSGPIFSSKAHASFQERPATCATIQNCCKLIWECDFA